MTTPPPLTRANVIALARTFKGTPWRHQGRSIGPNGGLDCIGLPVKIADHFGLPYQDRRNYPRYVMDPWLLIEALTPFMRLLDHAEVQPGDMAVCRIRRDYAHVVLRTDRGAIHVLDSAGLGQVIESANWVRWAPRLICGFAFPGIQTTLTQE